MFQNQPLISGVNNMYRRPYYRNFGIAVLFVFVAWFVWQPLPVNAQACTNNSECIDKACVVSKICSSTWKLSFSPLSGQSSTGYTQGIGSDTLGSFSVYSCPSYQTVCQPQAKTNSALWSQQTGNEPIPIVRSNLRPGRTYTTTYQGTVNDSFTPYYQRQVTMWPGYQSPSDLNLQVTNITDVSATVTWTTPFDGDTLISYAPVNPPTTATEFNIGNASENIADIEMWPNSEGWAVTNQGRAFRRSSSGSWAPSVAGTGQGYAKALTINTVQRAWIANGNIIAYTIDGGASWVSTNLPVIENINDVFSATPDTAWVVTDVGRIYFLDRAVNPTLWNLKYTASPGANIQSITTLDNISIWAVAENSTLFISHNNGNSWTRQTVGVGGEAMRAIDTLDGQTVWIAANGKVYISSDAGASWVPRTTIAGIGNSLRLMSQNEGWLVQAGKIVHYNSSTSTTVIGAQTAEYLNDTLALSYINGAHLIIGDQDGLIGRYTQPGSVYSDATPTKTHSYTFPNDLLPGSQIFIGVQSTGAGVSSGTFYSFSTASVDSTPPTISFTNPASTPRYTNINPYPVAGIAADELDDGTNGRLTAVTLTNNGAGQSVSTTPALGTNPPSVTWNSTVNLVPGNNTLVATAADASPSSANTSASATLVLDTVAPVVTISAPSNGATVSTSLVPVSGTATDNDQVAVMEYQLNGSPTRTAIGISPSNFVSWGMSVTPVLGPNTLIVFARDRAGNEGSTTVNFTYAEPTFTLSVNPVTQTRNPGDVVTYAVTATPVNGFNGNVTLSVSNAPGGSTTNFAPQPLSVSGGPATTTLTINTNTTTTGTFAMVITGIGNGKSATTNATLILSSFTLSSNPSAHSILGGQSASSTIRASADPNFNGTVTYTLSGAPSGVNLSIIPGSVTLTPSSFLDATLSITTTAAATPGSHTIIVTGTSGTLVRTAIVTLNISAPPDIVLTVLPTSQSITAGGSTFFNGAINSVNGFNESVTVSITSVPSHPDLTWLIAPATFVPPAAPPQPVAINISTTSAVPTGTYTLTVTARNASASVQKTVDVTLQIGADITPPVISNIVATPNWDRVRVTWQTDEPANSAIAIYDDVGRTQLVGVISDLQFCTSACHDLLYQPLQPITTYYFTVTSCDQDASAPLPTPNCATATTDASSQPLQFTTLDTPDTIPPVIISLDNPADGTTVFGNVVISGSASDNKNMSSVQVTVTPIGGGPAVFDLSVPCTGLTCTFSTSWNTLSDPNGLYTVSVVARDAATNVSNPPTTATVTVDNDTSAPELCPGTDVIANPTAVAGQTGCGGGQCWQAVITWCTVDPATTEVEYGTSVNCGSGGCSYPNPTVYGDPTDPGKMETNHVVTLRNLDANQLYHYRITSCDASTLCVH